MALAHQYRSTERTVAWNGFVERKENARCELTGTASTSHWWTACHERPHQVTTDHPRQRGPIQPVGTKANGPDLSVWCGA